MSRWPSISAASPGHSISGSDRGPSALVSVCYQWASIVLYIADGGERYTN